MRIIITDRDIDQELDDGWKRLEHYKNAHTEFMVMCSNGHKILIRWDHYKKGVRCKFCAGLARLTNEDIDRRLDNEWTRLSDYVNNRTPLELICPNGHHIKMEWANYQQGKRCVLCFKENNRGSNHRSWKFWLTNEDRERLARRNLQYDTWRLAVFKRDNYTCKKCGIFGKNLRIHAHHLYNFKEYKELRCDVGNGVTMCESCHVRFHNIYGRANNTPEQFLEFIS